MSAGAACNRCGLGRLPADVNRVACWRARWSTWGWLSRVYQFSAAATVIQEITPVDLAPWPPTSGVQWRLGTLVQDDTKLPWDMAFQLTTYQWPYGAGSAVGDPNSDGKAGLFEATVRAAETPEKQR